MGQLTHQVCPSFFLVEDSNFGEESVAIRKPHRTLAFVLEAMPSSGLRQLAPKHLDVTFNSSWRRCRGGGVEQALRDTATTNLSYNRAGISKAVQYSCSSVQYSANPAKVHIQRSVSNLNRLQLPLLCRNILKGQVFSPNIKGALSFPV